MKEAQGYKDILKRIEEINTKSVNYNPVINVYHDCDNKGSFSSRQISGELVLELIKISKPFYLDLVWEDWDNKRFSFRLMTYDNQYGGRESTGTLIWFLNKQIIGKNRESALKALDEVVTNTDNRRALERISRNTRFGPSSCRY